ncbi:MAG: PTS sugar transporter subunit IIA [Planctomycetes bacterium]|jgi:mannitol/fructose-specific phosphotransferase system IIA component (Ntr-type)|nr:PTS sugar transporter subunit IIA [Planctomycetota bacterium]
MTATRMSQVIVAKAFTVLPNEADKRQVISTLVQSLATAKKFTADKAGEIVEGAMAREAIGSTGIGHGIAIPHCRTPHVKEIVCSYGSSTPGIDFDSLDGEAVHSVFLLLTPPDMKEQHLTLMKSFASQIRKEHFCEFLHQVTAAQPLVDLLNEFEAR